MTDNNYPPLPEEAVYCDACNGFSAAQMHAYIDADRAQRKPLTDEQIERIYYKFGGDMINCARSIERHHGINPPPRPDAGNN